MILNDCQCTKKQRMKETIKLTTQTQASNETWPAITKKIKNYDSFCFFAHKNIFDVHSTCNPVLKNGYFNEHSNTKVGGLLQERPLHTYSESQGQEVWPVQQIPFASQVYPG